MNITCNDRDRIFADGTAAEWAALEVHAGSCAACAEEFRAWKALSAAAAELRNYSDDPSLWPKIRQSLAEHAEQHVRSRTRWDWFSLVPRFSLSWQAAAATAFIVFLMISGAWFVSRRPIKDPIRSPLLRSRALHDVDRAQSAYVEAINKLAEQVKPQLENADTPLMANYREKLLVLDSAISDLQAQAGQNPSNAHLRYQLLAMYQEKQRTLEGILEEKR